MLGRSAGGGSVAALLAMPRSAGLFHRAIAQSVHGTSSTSGLASDIARAYAAGFGLEATAADLSTVDPELLPAAGDEVMATVREHVREWGRAVRRALPGGGVAEDLAGPHRRAAGPGPLGR